MIRWPWSRTRLPPFVTRSTRPQEPHERLARYSRIMAERARLRANLSAGEPAMFTPGSDRPLRLYALPEALQPRRYTK